MRALLVSVARKERETKLAKTLSDADSVNVSALSAGEQGFLLRATSPHQSELVQRIDYPHAVHVAQRSLAVGKAADRDPVEKEPLAPPLDIEFDVRAVVHLPLRHSADHAGRPGRDGRSHRQVTPVPVAPLGTENTRPTMGFRSLPQLD